jgi:predicted ATPase/DNA-binding winged helix-turn-helix (wHTH) protein
MVDTAPQDRTVSFGPFTLHPARRLLLEASKLVRLTSRAMEILIALLERPGELVSKRQLIERVWPDTVVLEANLAVNVAALRRALGDGQGENRYIINVPGRGYRFVAPVKLMEAAHAPALSNATSERSNNLPHHVTRLVGRTDLVKNVARQQLHDRLVTIVGPGGIGKTVFALAVAEELIGEFQDGVWFVELSSITSPALVGTAVGTALNLEVDSNNPVPGLSAALTDKSMLLVLDNCEHLIDEVATLISAILNTTRRVSVLATSREPLSVSGERLYRLPALAAPPNSDFISATEALTYPAVQLFAERAASLVNDFELSDVDAAKVADICRRLDGLPLAIEFAAARTATFGVSQIALRLADRLGLLKSGARGTPPRHQTIAATLDWSYQLLSEEEQTVFRRMAIFSGGFTLESASAVATEEVGLSADIGELVASLVMKSLIAADAAGSEMRFRLLETTRSYARTKLAESGELGIIARRHAGYFWDLLERSGTELRFERDSYAGYVSEIVNIRAALTWAFDADGDDSVGVGLAATSAWIWLGMSLLTECQKWMSKALTRLVPADRGTYLEMTLQYTYGFSSMYSQGASKEAHAALTRASEIAESLGDLDYQVRALAALIIYRQRVERFCEALELAQRIEAIAKKTGNREALSIVDSALGASYFFLGNYIEALPHCRRAHAEFLSAPSWRKGHAAWNRCTLGHVLWLLGLIDESVRAASDTVTTAKTIGGAVLLCRALVWSGCDLPLRLGNLSRAEQSIDLLKEIAEKNGLSTYYPCAVAFEGQVAVRRGNFAAGQQLLRAGVEGLRQAESETQFFTLFLSSLAEASALNGDTDEGLALAEEAIQRAERAEAFWWMPEALRIRGHILTMANGSKSPEAEGCFQRAIDLARRQGALSWQLRAATSLGRLYYLQKRHHDARELLRSVFTEFKDGLDTYDLRQARALLDDLSTVDH